MLKVRYKHHPPQTMNFKTGVKLRTSVLRACTERPRQKFRYQQVDAQTKPFLKLSHRQTRLDYKPQIRLLVRFEIQACFNLCCYITYFPFLLFNKRLPLFGFTAALSSELVLLFTLHRYSRTARERQFYLGCIQA